MPRQSHHLRPGLQPSYGSAGECDASQKHPNQPDPWPQAISRSHRYGQTKKVLVFKLMTKNSVEGKSAVNARTHD